jgi:hypothetical protein
MTGNNYNNNDNLDWEYFQVRKFYDPFKRELEAYTGIRPVKNAWSFSNL